MPAALSPLLKCKSSRYSRGNSALAFDSKERNLRLRGMAVQHAMRVPAAAEYLATHREFSKLRAGMESSLLLIDENRRDEKSVSGGMRYAPQVIDALEAQEIKERARA